METAFQIFLFDLGIGFLLLLCAVGVFAILFGALWMYRDAQSRRMDATLWIVLLILATVFLSLLGFIIVVVIYLVVRESHPVGGMPAGYGYGPMPPQVPPVPPAAAAPAACPVCGNPMTWYPQYARWYCPTCAQYR